MSLVASRYSVFLVAACFTAAAALAFTACSSDTTVVAGDGGSDAGSGGDVKQIDSFVPPAEDSGKKPTPAECENECFKTFATSKPAYDAVDTCWTNKCKGPCVDGTGGFDGGASEGGAPDAGDAGAQGICGTDYGSDDVDCDNCTTANCCTEWKGCYGDTKCQGLDKCIGDCNP